MDSLQLGLTRLNLQPRDVLLVQVPKSPEQRELELLISRLRDVLPNVVSALIVSDDIKLGIIRNGQLVPPEIEPAVIVDVPIPQG